MKRIFLLLFSLGVSCSDNQDKAELNNTGPINPSKSIVTNGIMKPIKKKSAFTEKTTPNPSVIIANRSEILTLKDTPTFAFWSKENELQTSTCTSILQDKNQTYWFGTINGIYKLEGKTFTIITEKEGLPSNAVNSIIEDQRGGIWIGTSGGGLSFFDGTRFKNYTTNDGLPSNTIYRVFQDRNNNIWLGTSKGASLFDGKTFTNYSENDGFSNVEVKCLIQDKRDNIWLGTFGEGVFKFDGEKFINFTISEGLAGNAISCLFEDQNGNILISCLKSGLSSYDGQSITTIPISKEFSSKALNTYTTLKVEPGNLYELCSDIRSIIQDKFGTIWLGLSHGIGQLEINDSKNITSKICIHTDLSLLGKYYNYDYESCNINSVFLDKSGDVLWGIEDKIRKITPDNNNKNSALDSMPPVAFIKNVKLFNEKIEWYNFSFEKNLKLTNGIELHDIKFDSIDPYYYFPENLSLPYDNNSISFDFNAVNTSLEKISEFKYKLDGLEDNWTSLQTNSEVRFSGLSHGKYTFILKAKNKSGIWSAPVSCAFIIHPPWWHSVWFRSICFLIIIISLYAFYQWRTKSLRERQKHLEKTVLERTAELIYEKKIVEQKQKEIIESIHYARRIQRALITSEKYIEKKLKDLTK